MIQPTDPVIPDRRPTPCFRCGDAAPLTEFPRDELYFYTAAVSVSQPNQNHYQQVRFVCDTDRPVRGRLCEGCTRDFAAFAKKDPT